MYMYINYTQKKNANIAIQTSIISEQDLLSWNISDYGIRHSIIWQPFIYSFVFSYGRTKKWPSIHIPICGFHPRWIEEDGVCCRYLRWILIYTSIFPFKKVHVKIIFFYLCFGNIEVMTISQCPLTSQPPCT